MTNPTYKQTAAMIKNDRSLYKKNAWELSNTVMHKMPGNRPAAAPSAPSEIETYVFHGDPEINNAARKHVRENYGREAWKVSGEIYADMYAKIRKLEELTEILLNEPSQEMLDKSASLKEAYQKYKFIEKLALEKN